jgi:DNA repair exonuclease SbcCD ATPase subunit
MESRDYMNEGNYKKLTRKDELLQRVDEIIDEKKELENAINMLNVELDELYTKENNQTSENYFKDKEVESKLRELGRKTQKLDFLKTEFIKVSEELSKIP